MQKLIIILGTICLILAVLSFVPVVHNTMQYWLTQFLNIWYPQRDYSNPNQAHSLPIDMIQGKQLSAIRSNQKNLVSAVVSMDFIYPVDYANDKVLLGASHDVFIGKVISQTGTIDRGAGPETQFAVKVIYDIKGNLQGTVTVDQQGGYKDNVLYVVGDSDVLSSDPSKSLLQSGTTHLFVTRYSPTYNWYTLNSFPATNKIISTNNSLSDSQLRVLTANDPRVQQLQAAYPNEILLRADIIHNNTLNSYQSLTEAQKYALPDYAGSYRPSKPAPTSATSSTSN